MLYAFMFSSFLKIQRDKFDEKLIIHLTFTQVKFFSFGFYEHSLLQKLLFESARKLSPGDLLMFYLLTIKSHVCTLYRIQISELLVGLQNPWQRTSIRILFQLQYLIKLKQDKFLYCNFCKIRTGNYFPIKVPFC